MPESYNKLVRDKIPEILDAKNVSYEKRIASSKEYKIKLINKLSEEAKEFLEAGDPGELADVIEVIEALKALPDYKKVEELRNKKLKERGGFIKRIIISGERG